MSSQKENRLVNELVKLMYVQDEGEWGPNPVRCRWCGCWLSYSDGSTEKPIEKHESSCFAAVYLNRPT